MVEPSHFSLRLVRLPTRSSLHAAHGVPTKTFRMLTIVGVHCDNDLTTTLGWGECSALNEAGYTNEWAEGAFDLLRSGAPISVAAAPMAAAAVEMALLDAELKQAGETLANRLGTTGQKSRAGAVVGLAALPIMLDEIEQLASDGYTRIKIKIAPGRIVGPVRAVHSSFPELELQVDANGSLRAPDLEELIQLRDFGVRVVEQPFAVDDQLSAAKLVAQTDLVVAADEAVRSAVDVHELAQNRAATAIVVKPSKLGGLEQAMAILEAVQATGMQATIGGMLESGLGRHLLAALAPLPGFTQTGDLSPARRWLAADPFPDLAMRRGMIAAPKRLGIAGEPDYGVLDRYTVRTAVVTATAATALTPRS